jgi:hypothetical protein
MRLDEPQNKLDMIKKRLANCPGTVNNYTD